MKAISIQQPWASLIVRDIKPIENRTWKTNFRGRVYVHASSRWDIRSNSNNPDDLFTSEQKKDIPYYLKCELFDYGVLVKDETLPLSAIIGEVTIVDCVQNHPSIWAEKGCWNWVLEDPVKYEKPFYNVKGKLSFWEFEKPV